MLRDKIYALLRYLTKGAALTAAAFAFTSAQAREFDIEIIADGLSSPMGITNTSRFIYYSEVPDPGVFGTEGGNNTVKRLDLKKGTTKLISDGEPYPVNLALDGRGRLYWTCQTAGVILRYSRFQEKEVFLTDLLMPTGIDVSRRGDVLFTELPMPGEVGTNMVSVTDGENISLISDDEPAPTDITISPFGTAYWTCNTAGVILKRSPAGVISLLKDGLESPTGIALDRTGRRLYYTELPTPGVGGENGGTNRVVELNLKTMETTNVSEGFPWPNDVTVASNGKIYWTCTTVGVIACATPSD